MGRKSGLVLGRLEDISRDLFSKHFDIITELIGSSHGIYALYDGDELYYVGKSTDMKNRVKNHLKDRHLAGWTRFSLYLTRKEDYIHDIESLLIRIANPKGNRKKPRSKAISSMLGQLRRLIMEKQKVELDSICKSEKRGKRLNGKKAHPETLAGFVRKPTPIYRTYRGKEHKATLFPKGFIRYKKNNYDSPSGAAKAIIKKGATNGWFFWNIQNTHGEWVKLANYK